MVSAHHPELSESGVGFDPSPGHVELAERVQLQGATSLL